MELGDAVTHIKMREKSKHRKEYTLYARAYPGQWMSDGYDWYDYYRVILPDYDVSHAEDVACAFCRRVFDKIMSLLNEGNLLMNIR
jgi:hypothetical protein